jgi:hypothetical protein
MCSGLLLCRKFCDWHIISRHTGGIPHAGFGRRVSRCLVPTRWSASKVIKGTEELLKLQVSREIYWWKLTCELATSFIWPYTPWFFSGGCLPRMIYCINITIDYHFARRTRHAVFTAILHLRKNMWHETEKKLHLLGRSHPSQWTSRNSNHKNFSCNLLNYV